MGLSREEKLEKRAMYEISVIKACVGKYDDKIATSRDEYEGLKHAGDLIKEKALSAKNSGDQEMARMYAKEAKNNDMICNIKKGNMNVFLSTQAVLEKLYNLCMSLLDRGYYQLIIKKIPEKKLPRLVRDPKKLKPLYELVNKIYQDLSTEVQQLAKYDADLRESMEQTDRQAEAYDRLFNHSNDDLDSYLEGLEKTAQSIDDVREEVAEAVQRVNKA